MVRSSRNRRRTPNCYNMVPMPQEEERSSIKRVDGYKLAGSMLTAKSGHYAIQQPFHNKIFLQTRYAMKKVFFWKKVFACPSCGEKVAVSVWDTLPSMYFGPEKYTCLNCKEILVLPKGWIAASGVATFIAVMIGIIILIPQVSYNTSGTTVFLLFLAVGLPAMWLGGIVALMASHLTVFK